MKITRLSENQRFVFRWWTARELSDYDGIICDGAVRSGKTFCLSASFMTWAMTNFDECIFGLCSKTIVSLKRNILPALRGYMKAMGMTAVEVASKNYMDVSFCGRKNRFYYFGGMVVLVGSLYKSHTKIRGSFLKWFITSFTYFSSLP